MIKYQIYNYSKANNIASLVIHIHLLLNTDSADFTDILAQSEASV